MNIISSFKDYYDFVFPMDKGETPWIRETKEFYFLISDLAFAEFFKEHTSAIRNIFSGLSNYLMTKFSKKVNDQDKTYTRIYILVIGEKCIFIKESYSNKISDVYSHVEDLNTKTSSLKVSKYVQDRLKDIFVRACADLQSPTTLFRINKGQFWVYTNVCLKPYTAAIPFSQMEVYNLVQNYLSNMHKDKTLPFVGDDKVILEQKGFDENSFRKGKQK